MNPSKEVIDAAEEYADSIVHRGHDMWRVMILAFRAGDSNGYSRAMERITALESALKKAKSRNHDLDIAMGLGKPEMAQEIWRHQAAEIDQALKGT